MIILTWVIHLYLDLGALGDAVELIAQKHVSLYVMPEEYGIVGENLLASIKEVLGDAATPEIVEAWKESYFFLADILIERERAIREGLASAPGGWSGWRDFIVADKVEESSEITSFYLKAKDGGALLNFIPGQYIALRLHTPNLTTIRNYSLSIAPGMHIVTSFPIMLPWLTDMIYVYFVGQNQYRISVKKQGPMASGCPMGKISNYLHDDVKIGDVLEVSVPCGDFALKVDHDKPIVLISGGVGVTPLMSMLEHMVNTKVENKINFVNVVRNRSVEAMHDAFVKYESENSNVTVSTCYTDGEAATGCPHKPIDQEYLSSVIPSKDAHFYFCGPPGFMVNLKKILTDWNVPANQIHYEFFGPLE